MKVNKRIIHALIIVSVMFLSLVTYLLYFKIFLSAQLNTNAYNKRQWDDEKKVLRGNIYDAGGILLARTIEDKNGKKVREYTKGALYSGIIGYCSEVYGKTQLEMKYDGYLLGREGFNLSLSEVREGYNLTLTIDDELQKYAYDSLNGKSGAIIAMEPKTGKILAMVSRPSFDPNPASLEKNWQSIVEREDSPLINRPAQGLYAPGSIYKIVTAAAAFENGKKDEIFEDTGSFDIGGNSVKNNNGKAYGAIDLSRGFAVSSNFVFLKLGFEMGEKTIRDIAQRFGIDSSIDFDIPVSKGTIGYKRMTNADCALVSIGQGKLLITPLNAAMITGAIANDGRMMKPYIVEKVTRGSGTVVRQAADAIYSRPVSEQTAIYITELMVRCVNEGSGTNAKISGIQVAGKTGTAENEQTAQKNNKTHAWFTGFAPAEDPKILVVVALEYSGGSGGENAAPIARNIMRKYLQG